MIKTLFFTRFITVRENLEQSDRSKRYTALFENRVYQISFSSLKRLNDFFYSQKVIYGSFEPSVETATNMLLWTYSFPCEVTGKAEFQK